MTANEGVESVDRGDAGFDKVIWFVTGYRVNGATGDGPFGFRDDLWQTIDGFAEAIEPPSDDVFGERNGRTFVPQGDGSVFHVDALRSLKHLNDGVAAAGFKDLALTLSRRRFEGQDRTRWESAAIFQEYQRP